VNVDQAETVEQFLGKMVHVTLEKLYKDKLNGKLWQLDALLHFYDSEWERQWHPNIKIVRTEYTADDIKSVGGKCIEDYYHRYTPFDTAKTIGLERILMIDLDGTGRYKLQGFIDRLDKVGDGVYEIHDYKTAGHLPTQEEKDNDRQLALYEIGLRQMWNDVKDTTLIWHYLRFDTEIRSKRTREQLEQLKQEIVMKIDAIEQAAERNDFPAVVSTLCDWCAYRDICPQWKHLIAVEGLPLSEYTRESGVKLVNTYAELEQQKKELKKQIDVIDAKQEQIKSAAVQYAEKSGIERIVGSSYQLTVIKKVEDHIPTKTDEPEQYEALDNLLRNSPYWGAVSDISRKKILDAINSNLIDSALLSKVREYIPAVQTTEVKLKKLKSRDEK